MKVLVVIFLLFLAASPHANNIPEIPGDYQPLIDRLTGDGFDPGFLLKIFTDDRAEVIPDRMMISLGSPEKGEWYVQFLSPESILLAKNF
ncbi:MAG: hypothetical protein EHM36_04315, partial [Deltaproteobacteria bacterium]